MSSDDNLSLGEVVNYVHEAWRQLDSNEVNKALTLLEDAELEFDKTASSATSHDSVYARHLLLWVLMTRGTVLMQLARFEEAESLFEIACSEAQVGEASCKSESRQRFARELIDSTSGYAFVVAAQGRYSASIDALLGLEPLIPVKGHSKICIVLDNAMQDIDVYGEILGYEDLLRDFS